MISEFVTDRDDSFASLPMIPLPPCLFGAVNTPEQTDHGAEQLLKRREGSTLTESLILFPELPFIDICVFGLYHSAYHRSSERLGKYQRCFQGQGYLLGVILCAVQDKLAFERKRK